MNRTRTLVLQEIIRVAAVCFGETGYRAATLDTITAKVGISKVTLYTYVSSKEELLWKVFERTIESVRLGLRQIIDQPLPADEKLRRIVRHHVGLLTSNLPFMAVFFSEESGLAPEVATQVARAKREYDRAIEGVVRHGIDAGLLRDLPPTLVVFAILGMCNWLYKWYRPGGKLAPEQIADVFVDLLERGYLRRAAEAGGDQVLVALRSVEERLTGLERRLGGSVPGPRQRRRSKLADVRS